MNTIRRGSGAENLVWRELERHGYLVASRRHVGGAGDLLAINADISTDPKRPLLDFGLAPPLLIEVKHTARGPFANFPPADRRALAETAHNHGCDALLAWVYGERIFWIPEDEWPQ